MYVCGFRWNRTNRFEVGDTLACGVPGLRAQKTFFLEYKAGAYEETAGDCENDTDDLEWREIEEASGDENGTLRLEGSCIVVVLDEEEEDAALNSRRGGVGCMVGMKIGDTRSRTRYWL